MSFTPRTIFDIGMFDGADTAYYLDLGARVVAVEANPALVERAQLQFAKPIESGMLRVLNVAISQERGEVELTICGTDLGSISIYADQLSQRHPLGSFKVPAITFADQLQQEGTPDFLKIDIEGADHVCERSLTA